MRRRKHVDFVESVVTHVVDVLRSAANLPDDQAKAHGREIARRICTEYQRTTLYVPTTMTWDVTERDEQVWTDYSSRGPTGTPPWSQDRVEEVAEAHGITASYVYQIVKMVRDRQTRDRQGQLALDADEHLG